MREIPLPKESIKSQKAVELRGVKYYVIDDFLKLKYIGIKSISEIDKLSSLTDLTGLSLWHNRIEKIEGLDNLTNLTYLGLGYNRIRKIEGLEKLTNLQTLNLSNNQITKIEGIDTLTKLEKLYLGTNSIRKITGLGSLRKLILLDIRDNPVNNEEFSSISQRIKVWYGSLSNVNLIEEKNISKSRVHESDNTIFLTNEEIPPKILEMIASAKEELLFMSPWIYHVEIMRLLKEKIDENLSIKIICRRAKEKDYNHLKSIKKLDEYGIQIAFIDNIHNKIIIKDKKEILQGSKNLTKPKNEPIDGGIWSEVPTVVKKARNYFFRIYDSRFKNEL